MEDKRLLHNVSNNVVNRKKSKWVRPWNLKQFNDLYNRDERFFSILIKGAIAYLNSHIKMYDKSINHFIFNTGSSYMFVESNGYEFSWNETSGEDNMYMELPRCVVELGNINIPTEELSQPYARGNYERKEDDKIKGFNSEICRLPIEMTLTLHYAFSNFNESIVVLQELFDELVFQKYFNIAYLGQIIRCSIEFPNTAQINIGKIDFSAAELVQRNIDIDVTICANYPIVNDRSEIDASKIISKFKGYLEDRKRSDTIEIIIDGVKSTSSDIYIDLRKFDLNKDGIISEDEISIIREFIERFDLDEDFQVSSHDISIITEEFATNAYNIKYDILNIGTYDLKNLLAIKQLYELLDLNHDGYVNDFEIDEILRMINIFLKFDLNGDLLINYQDVNALLSYIELHENVKYEDLLNDLTAYLKSTIKEISEELYNYIIDILNENIADLKLAIEYWLSNHEDVEITNAILQELYRLIDALIDFLRYDFNNDGVINKNDAQYITDNISDYTEHVITYYRASEIIIHMNDHSLSDDSISDIVTF